MRGPKQGKPDPCVSSPQEMSFHAFSFRFTRRPRSEASPCCFLPFWEYAGETSATPGGSGGRKPLEGFALVLSGETFPDGKERRETAFPDPARFAGTLAGEGLGCGPTRKNSLLRVCGKRPGPLIVLFPGGRRPGEVVSGPRSSGTGFRCLLLDSGKTPKRWNSWKVMPGGPGNLPSLLA